MFLKMLKFYKVYKELFETETFDPVVRIKSINKERVESMIKLMKTDDTGSFRIIVNRFGIVFDDVYEYFPAGETFVKRGVFEQECEKCEEEDLKTDLMTCSKFMVIPTTKTFFAWEGEIRDDI